MTQKKFWDTFMRALAFNRTDSSSVQLQGRFVRALGWNLNQSDEAVFNPDIEVPAASPSSGNEAQMRHLESQLSNYHFLHSSALEHFAAAKGRSKNSPRASKELQIALNDFVSKFGGVTSALALSPHGRILGHNEGIPPEEADYLARMAVNLTHTMLEITDHWKQSTGARETLRSMVSELDSGFVIMDYSEGGGSVVITVRRTGDLGKVLSELNEFVRAYDPYLSGQGSASRKTG
jgi:hypothetical protein